MRSFEVVEWCGMDISNAVTVIVIYSDDLSQLSSSLHSLSKQTCNLHPRFIFTGRKNLESFSAAVRNGWPQADIVACVLDELPHIINRIINDADGQYVTLLTTGDIYHDDRLETLIQESVQRDSDILITYAELVDHGGRRITGEESVGRTYNRGLLTNIAAHPTLSFVLLWFDVLLSAGNLFFSKKLFIEIGGFNSHRNLFAFDFLLRAARTREPTIITTKLISCRPQYLSKSLNLVEETEEERATIIQSHLLALLEAPPKNYACDVFRSHAFMFAGVPWSQGLADAVDTLLETRRPTKGMVPESRNLKANSDLDGREFTLLTHELSLTGAPVIILEMASLMRDRGAAVKVISPTDGPLRENFERRGIKVTILPSVHPRLIALETFLIMNQEPRRQLIGLVKWLLLKSIRLLRRIFIVRGRRWLKKNVRSPILINSVAAWEWVYQCLRAGNSAQVFWYVHETFDPKWMASDKADKLFRGKIESGILQMLYGSDATREAWTSEGYPGLVRYWSGIKISDHPGDQLSAIAKSSVGKVILNVGNVGSRKGTRTLLEAFAIGRKNGTIPLDVELRIVGCPKPSGSQEARDVVFRAAQPDLRNSVRIFESLKPEVLPSLYDEADFYVHASFFDCMPIAILTAMARGMPIVATDVDGCGEAIVNESSGLLVPTRDPERLAQAMGRMIADKDLRERLGRGAREMFERKLAVESTLDQVVEVFPS
jgi:glycosyltransferase involved in cell wall biosynthesis